MKKKNNKCTHKGKTKSIPNKWIFTVEEVNIICEKCGKILKTKHFV